MEQFLRICEQVFDSGGDEEVFVDRPGRPLAVDMAADPGHAITVDLIDPLVIARHACASAKSVLQPRFQATTGADHVRPPSRSPSQEQAEEGQRLAPIVLLHPKASSVA